MNINFPTRVIIYNILSLITTLPIFAKTNFDLFRFGNQEFLSGYPYIFISFALFYLIIFETLFRRIQSG